MENIDDQYLNDIENLTLPEARARIVMLSQRLRLMETLAMENTPANSPQDAGYLSQNIINAILQISEQDISLKQYLEYILNLVLYVPFLNFTQRGAVYMLSNNRNELELCAYKNVPESFCKSNHYLPADNDITGSLYLNGSIELRTVKSSESLITNESFYSVPITLQGEVLGVLLLVIPGSDKPEEREITFLESMGAILGNMIQRKRILEDLRRKNSDLETANKNFSQMMSDLVAAREALQLSLRAKDAFLSAISHELRTPLNSILGNIRILREKLHFAEEEESGLILDSAKSLLSTVNDLLDFSQLESGSLRMNDEECQADDLMKGLVESWRKRAESAGLYYRFEMQSSPAGKMIIDVSRIKTVLNHLLHNAVKYTVKGGIDVNVSWAANTNSGYSLFFTVKDTGPGFTEQEQSQLFKGFYHTLNQTQRRSQNGLGLGLTISKKLTETLKGQFIINTSENGTSISLNIPVTLSSGQNTTENQVHSVTFSDTQIQVLMVDDNLINLKVGGKLLEKMSCKVLLAGGGKEAMEILQTENVDLVFMDCQMPDMDGFETTRAMRLLPEPFKKVPIVALTANKIDGYRERCFQSGMDDFTTKPLHPRVIRQIFEKWVPHKKIWG